MTEQHCIWRDGCTTPFKCAEIGFCSQTPASKSAALTSKDESLQQRAMSFLSTLVNTQRWNYAQAYDLVRQMLDAKWNVPEAKPSRKYLNLGREYVRDHLKTIEGGTAVCLFAIWLDARTQAAETAKVEPAKDRVPDHELREYIEELEPGHTFHRLLTELALLRALTDMPVAATETGLTACAMCADGVGREYGYHMVNGEQIECPAVKRAHETTARPEPPETDERYNVSDSLLETLIDTERNRDVIEALRELQVRRAQKSTAALDEMARINQLTGQYDPTNCGPNTPWDRLCGEPACAYCSTRKPTDDGLDPFGDLPVEQS